MPLLEHQQARPISRVSPRLWLQRLALFSSFSPAAKFQEVIFTRGLNLIVGLDFPDPDREDDFGGHSVGKTTLCRLIRYCLGEPTFSTSQDQKLIRENFPHGWVGCEMHLDGELWSVLLPFERGMRAEPHAGENEALEDLFTQEKPDNQYLQYQQTLEALMPPDISRADAHFAWRHLLAWLMRDQKCIQDNFWDWRTPESESGSPQHRSRKKESEHLVRSVLGLLAGEENKLREELAELQGSLKRAEEAASEATILPELHKNMALRQLRNHSLLFSVKESEPLPEMAFAMHLAKEESRIQALEEEYNHLRAELASAEQNQQYWKSVRERQQALLAPHKGYLDGLRPPKAEDPNLAAIKEVADRECPATILYKDCQEVQKVWNALEQKSRGVDLASVMSEKEYQHVITIIAGLERTLREAQENETKAGEAGTELREKKIPIIYKELMAAHRRLDAQKTQWDILKESWSILFLNAPNTELQLATQAVEKLEEERGNIEMSLSIARHENIEKAAMVATRFDSLVKNVIGAKSSGKFLAGDEIAFSVSAKGAVGGDAMKVLQTILGDFASMLYAIEGAEMHPGFLVHDSPRQADMSIAWYRRLLTHAAEVSESAGGKDDAPFQYIITTTTAPPEILKTYVRKDFASIPPEKLLFKKRLIPLQANFEE